jgi:hypothetical protein
VLNRFLAIDDLRLVLSVGALVFGLCAIIAVAHSFSSGLRQIVQRARDLLDERRDGIISRGDWQSVIAGTPFEEIAPILLPARRLPFLHATPGEGDETNQFGTAEANMELRRLFWHRIARLQVWTATGILFAVGVLSLIYRRLGLDGDGSLIMLILAPAGILLIAICAALARLSVGRNIKEFFTDLTGAAVATPDRVLRLTSEMRVSDADRDHRQFDPTFSTPVIDREPARYEHEAKNLGLERFAEPVGDLGGSNRAELDAALARILASIERLETQQRVASQDAAALRDVVRGIGNRPSPLPRLEDDQRIASLQSSFAELMAEMRTAKERTDRELAAFVGEVRTGQQYHQQAIGELEGALARILVSTERLETQQRAASQDAAALRDIVHGIGNRPAPLPRHEDDERIASLQGSFAELMVDMRTAKERTDRELAAFVGEVRDGEQYHRQSVSELAASLNRLEARLVPILRHVAATNRAMALLSERSGRLETQLSKFEADLSQERATAVSVVTPLHPSASEERSAEFADITSELRQLLSELEDAAPSESQPEAQAAP